MYQGETFKYRQVRCLLGKTFKYKQGLIQVFMREKHLNTGRGGYRC